MTGTYSYPDEPGTPTAEPGQFPALDEAMDTLAQVADAPPAEQIAPLAAAHRVLRETLDTIGDV
jgi:hypothetical protein